MDHGIFMALRPIRLFQSFWLTFFELGFNLSRTFENHLKQSNLSARQTAISTKTISQSENKTVVVGLPGFEPESIEPKSTSLDQASRQPHVLSSCIEDNLARTIKTLTPRHSRLCKCPDHKMESGKRKLALEDSHLQSLVKVNRVRWISNLWVLTEILNFRWLPSNNFIIVRDYSNAFFEFLLHLRPEFSRWRLSSGKGKPRQPTSSQR